MSTRLKQIFDKWRADDSRQIRIMTFSASDSQFGNHTRARPNWFHWLEKTLRSDKPHFIMLNASIGGNCVRDLCGRFERDAAPLKPDLVFIDMGGNDANVPVMPDEFREKLTYLCKRVQEWGGIPVLQTLYTPVLTTFSAQYQELFPQLMQLNRDVAAELGIPCIDIERYFHPYYDAAPEEYTREIMVDTIHVNEVGNAVWGCIVADELGLPRPDLADMHDEVMRQLEKIQGYMK